MEQIRTKMLLQHIADEEIREMLTDANDMSFRVAALAELLRDAERLKDVTNFEEEIGDTIAVFLMMLRSILPREIPEFDHYVFELLEHRDPRLDHPEGQDFQEPKWRWPIVNFSSEGTGEKLQGGGFRNQSALKLFGYTVGRSNGWPEKKRQQLLSDFIELELPETVHKMFPNEYGKPNSTTRLRTVASFLANMASLAARRNSVANRYAIDDWTSDLEFLRIKYYEGQGLKFYPWPEVKER